MKNQGLTLFELVLTLAISCTLLAIAIPSLATLAASQRTYFAANSLHDAINTARALAVAHNTRSLLLTNQTWQDGWVLFLDANNNLQKDDDEPIIRSYQKLPGVRISGNSAISQYVSFISTGESRQDGQGTELGGFLAGSLFICPESPGEGYKLILARGGRLRSTRLTQDECEATL